MLRLLVSVLRLLLMNMLHVAEALWNAAPGWTIVLDGPKNEQRAMRREEVWRREFDEWCEMREWKERRAMDREDVNVAEPATPRSLKKRRYEEATPEKTTQANSDDTESEDSLADMLD